MGKSDFKLYKNTQQQMLKIPFVINSAMRSGELASLPEIAEQMDPMGWIRDNMKVSFPADGEVMQVSIEAKNPNSAVKIVNAVVNAYMDEVVLNERNERLQRRDNLERVYSEAEGKVRSKRAELKSLAMHSARAIPIRSQLHNKMHCSSLA